MASVDCSAEYLQALSVGIRSKNKSVSCRHMFQKRWLCSVLLVSLLSTAVCPVMRRLMGEPVSNVFESHVRFRTVCVGANIWLEIRKEMSSLGAVQLNVEGRLGSITYLHAFSDDMLTNLAQYGHENSTFASPEIVKGLGGSCRSELIEPSWSSSSDSESEPGTNGAV